MTSWPRLILILVALAFMAGTVAHAAQSAAASLPMATPGGGMSGDCGDCGAMGPDSIAGPCDEACASLALGLPAAGRGATIAIGDASLPQPAHWRKARTGPPEPYPPRAVLG